jgi:hypothetical protein
MMQMLNQLKANPAAMMNGRFNIPQGVTDPQQMVQHLMNSGQISQEQFNQARALAQQMGFKF